MQFRDHLVEFQSNLILSQFKSDFSFSQYLIHFTHDFSDQTFIVKSIDSFTIRKLIASIKWLDFRGRWSMSIARCALDLETHLWI